MAATWVTDPAWVTARYEGTIDPDLDGPRLTSVIEEAELLLRQHVPDVDTRLEAGLVTVDVLKTVIRTAVLRAWRNPAGMASEADGVYSYRRGVAVGDAVTFTAAELRMARGTLPQRARTIQLRPPPPWQEP